MSRTVTLLSSPMVNAAGVLTWAINGYRFERDRQQLKYSMMATWDGITLKEWDEILTGKIPHKLDGENVIIELPTTQEEARAQLTGELKDELISLLTKNNAMKSALEQFVEAINATGGITEDGDGYTVPVADEEWIDLGDAYVSATMALK